MLAKEIAKIERITERSNAIAGEGAKRFGDQFGNAVKMLTREAGSMFDTYGRPTGLGEAVLSADDPAAVINALGSDPDLAAEFADLSAVQQARRIARLEIELSKAPEIKHSNAPKPITPARGAASTEKSPAEMSDAEFAAWRKRQIAQRR